MKGGWIDPEKFGLDSRWYLGHTYRYYMAKGFLRQGETVLDAACGVGYGADIMSDVAGLVVALDIDDRAIKIAKQKHSKNNIKYAVCDFNELTSFPSVDVVVSFETIEHIESKPEHFASLVKSAAKRLICLSAPVAPTVHNNKYHKHDFTEKSLEKLITGDGWTLWEKTRQGPYLVLVVYKKS